MYIKSENKNDHEIAPLVSSSEGICPIELDGSGNN